MTSAKVTRRIIWNDTTFDTDALHLAMIDEINRLIHVADARTKALRASEARERRLRGALEFVMSQNKPKHGYTPDPLDYIVLSHNDVQSIRAALADDERNER